MPSSTFIKASQEYPLIVSGATETLTEPLYTSIIGIDNANMAITLPPIASCFEGYRIFAINNSPASITMTFTVSDTTTESFNNSTATNVVISQNASSTFMCDIVNSTWWLV